MLRALADLALVVPLNLAKQLPVGLERVGEAEITVDDVVLGPVGRIRQIFKVVRELESVKPARIPDEMMGIAESRIIVSKGGFIALLDPGGTKFLVEAPGSKPVKGTSSSHWRPRPAPRRKR